MTRENPLARALRRPLLAIAVVVAATVGLVATSACFSTGGGFSASSTGPALVTVGVAVAAPALYWLATKAMASPCREPKAGEALSAEDWDAVAACQEQTDQKEKAQQSRALALQARLKRTKPGKP